MRRALPPGRKPYPPGCPPEVYAALDAFTDEELTELHAFRESDGLLIGIGVRGPNGEYTRFGDPAKAAAIEVLEIQWEKEYQEYVLVFGSALAP